MKKLMVILLAAGLFVACGNKQKEEAPETDTTVVEAVDTMDVEVEEAPVAEVTEPANVQKPATKPAAPATQVKEEPKPEATKAEEVIEKTPVKKEEAKPVKPRR